MINWSREYEIQIDPLQIEIVFNSNKIAKTFLSVIEKEDEYYHIDSVYYVDGFSDIEVKKELSLYYNKKAFDISYIDTDRTRGVIPSGKVNEIYHYQGQGIPTEFIAEKSTERDYYTKIETNNLFDKKQNIADDDLQTIEKQIVPAIIENKNNIFKKQDKLNFIVV